VVEAATAVLFVLATLLCWHRSLLPLLPALLYLAAVGLALALIDIDVHRLPNVIVLPSYPVLAVLLTGASAWTGDWGALARAGIGAVALFAFYLLLVLIYPAGMGWGDVKLSGLLGAVLGYVGWSALLVGAFAGFFFGAVVAVVAMALGRAGRKTALPFGPFMIVGAAFGIAVGGWLGGLYVGALGG
jgi:leader peptidase (prepilin peptidase)/N-methyltransferase